MNKFRVGKKSGLAILDENGYEVAIFSKGNENIAQKEAIFLNNSRSTGAKDKNGTEIFEGCMLQNPIVMGVVRYVPEYCGFYLCYDKDTNYTFAEDSLSMPLYLANLSICEIIGNIYENTNLLNIS